MVRCDVHILVDGTDTIVMTGAAGPKWSPDGSSVAFTDSSAEILSRRLADGSVANLTNHPARDCGAGMVSRRKGRVRERPRRSDPNST